MKTKLQKDINLNSAVGKVLIFGPGELQFTFVFSSKNIYPQINKLVK